MHEVKRKKILLIDDEPILRRALQRWLSNQGWEVWESQNGQEAIHLIEQKSFEYFDHFILDWLMPIMGGEAFLRYAENQSWNLKKITILTAVDPAELGEWPKLVNRTLSKPIEDMVTFISQLSTEDS
jgi:CheY-like chemotaxis protein